MHLKHAKVPNAPIGLAQGYIALEGPIAIKFMSARSFYEGVAVPTTVTKALFIYNEGPNPIDENSLGQVLILAQGYIDGRNINCPTPFTWSGNIRLKKGEKCILGLWVDSLAVAGTQENDFIVGYENE